MRLRRESISRSRRPCSPLKRGVMGTERLGGGAVQSWVKPEVDPPRVARRAGGGAEEAHRRWPVGRGEHGREQGKCLPSKGFRAAAIFECGGHFLASPILGAGITTPRVLHQFF